MAMSPGERLTALAKPAVTREEVEAAVVRLKHHVAGSDEYETGRLYNDAEDLRKGIQRLTALAKPYVCQHSGEALEIPTLYSCDADEHMDECPMLWAEEREMYKSSEAHLRAENERLTAENATLREAQRAPVEVSGECRGCGGEARFMHYPAPLPAPVELPR